MIKVSYNTSAFTKKMDNLTKYSLGFLEGVERGKKKFFTNVGILTVEALKEFVDSMARVDPGMLQHVYEWNESGSPGARLFDIEYRVTGAGISLNSTFRQSTSIKSGSREPFYDKARIMEEGIPVTIRPRNASALSFDVDGEQVFTKNPVVVSSPGGIEAKGGFEKAFEIFMRNYFSQSFLSSSGILVRLKDISVFKRNLKSGMSLGRSKGQDVGYRWMASIGGIN